MNIKALSLSLLVSISMQAFTHHEFKKLSEEKKWEAHKILQEDVLAKDELISKYREELLKEKAEKGKIPYKIIGFSCLVTTVACIALGSVLSTK